MSGLPSRSVLDARLEAIRKRIFSVYGICGTSAEAAHHGASAIDGGLDHKTADYLWQALELATETLDGIAGDLDPAVILDSTASNEEDAEEVAPGD